MALLTSLREPGRHVIRIRGAIEILDVAGGAVRRRSHELPIDVALCTAHADMRAGQRKFRKCIVVKAGRIPRAAVMASLARGRESSLGMRRVGGLVEICHVTADAGCRRTHKLPANVAGIAIQGGMSTDQGEAGKLQVIELGSKPVIHGVALFAGGRQIQCNVIDTERFRIHEIALVAGEAHRGQSLELSHRSILVTGIAVHSGVGANQWEAVQVLINLLNGDMPALDGMALFAICAHLPLMNISVAVRALRAHIRKHHLGVTLRARDSFVQSAQGILSGVVIEFRYGTDRFPAAYCVAILAGNAKASVWAARVGRRLRLRSRWLSARKHRQCNYQMQQYCRSQGLPNPFEQEFDYETETSSRCQ